MTERKTEAQKAAEAEEKARAAQEAAEEKAREVEAQRLKTEAEAAAKAEADAARSALEDAQPQTLADPTPLADFAVVDGDSHFRREVARGARSLAEEWLGMLPEGKDRDAAMVSLAKAREHAAKAANGL